MRKTYVFMIITLLTIVFLPHYSYAARVLFVPASTVVWGGDTPSNQDLEDKQKLLEEKQKELEAKQAELEKKQKELEMKAEVKAEAKSVAKAPMSEEETKAYSELWDKAKVLESLVPIFEKKDKATQDRVRALVEWFKLSNDNYTKNIGFYLSYLLR